MHNYLYQQTDLELMSKELELKTKEIFHRVNDFYGQASILRKYTKYPFSLKVVWEHSIPFHDIIWTLDDNSPLPTRFVSSKHRLKVYLKSNKKKRIKKIIYNIGSIMNYVKYLYEKQNKYIDEPNKKGSVYFPTHSTHHIKTEQDNNLIITKLNELPESYKPITICMYWKDIQYKYHKIYIDNGFQVISAGHIYDKNFYFRLYDILIRHKFALGSTFGTFVLHAAFCGCKVVLPLNLKVEEKCSISTEGFSDPDLKNRLKIYNEFNEKIINLFNTNDIDYNNEELAFLNEYSSNIRVSKLKLFLIFLLSDILFFIPKIFLIIKYIYKKIKLRLMAK